MAQIQSLALELPYAEGVAKKRERIDCRGQEQKLGTIWKAIEVIPVGDDDYLDKVVLKLPFLQNFFFFAHYRAPNPFATQLS